MRVVRVVSLDLTETAEPFHLVTRQVEHVNDNFGAAFGRLPDAALRRRQEEFFDSLS